MSIRPIAAHIRETTRLQAVGRCIYCGSKSNLTDEHIVPLGLGGNLVLPESSCKACAAVTSKIEQNVLRGFMLPARTVGGFPTRRPKERPTEFELEAVRNDDGLLISLSASQFPALLPLPQFPAAGFLIGKRTSSGLVVIGRETLRFGKPPESVLEHLSARMIRLTINVDAHSFAQMLAKIGYAYFVGINGIVDLEAAPVLPFIKGERDDGDLWIGSATFETESEKKGALHVLQLIPADSTRPSVDVARLKLFAGSATGGYEIVTHINM